MSGGGTAAFSTVVDHFHRVNTYAEGQGPNHWNGADMMVIGIKGLSIIEYISHFSMWRISAAPLWIGCDLTKQNQTVIDILSNKEVIDVNQDEWGLGAMQLDGLHSAHNNTEVWWKILKPQIDEINACAVLLFNTITTMQQMYFDFWEIGINGNANVRDLWQHKDLGKMNKFSGNVAGHGVIMLRVSQ
eukprot:758120_1